MPSFSTATLPSLRISSRPVVEAALSLAGLVRREWKGGELPLKDAHIGNEGHVAPERGIESAFGPAARRLLRQRPRAGSETVPGSDRRRRKPRSRPSQCVPRSRRGGFVPHKQLPR